LKHILLSLIVATPICAMQPEKKVEVAKNVRQIATVISIYNSLKPMELIPCIMPQPSLWPLAVPIVGYAATELAIDMYKKSYMTEESKK
jgi:hypothetical protein